MPVTERPHATGDPLGVDPPPFLAELGRYARGAVGTAGLAVDPADLPGQHQVLVLRGSPGLGAVGAPMSAGRFDGLDDNGTDGEAAPGRRPDFCSVLVK